MSRDVPSPDLPARPLTSVVPPDVGPTSDPARTSNGSAEPNGGWAPTRTPLTDLVETGIENPELVAALSEHDVQATAESPKELEEAVATIVRLRDLVLETQRDCESRLREKEELIQALDARNLELEEAAASRPATPKEEELLALSEELERERCQLYQERRELDEFRRRLSQDEQDMQGQMREVEVQMARERADYARRRNELQRILDEIRRELEKAERLGHLNQRLGQLRERFADVADIRGAPGGAAPATPRTPPPKGSGPRRFLG